MKIVDLSVTLGGPKFTPPAFFPPVIFDRIHTHEVHKKLNTRLDYPVHVGTHADSPYHALADGQSIDELPLDRFIGPAVRVDLRQHTKPSTPFTLEQLTSSVPRGISLRGKIVALNSGWLAKMYGTQEYYDQYPSLTTEAVQWLIEQGIKTVALDFAVDANAASTIEGGFGHHRLLGGAGIPIIENVTNLEEVPTEFQFIGFPAKLYRCDGGPVRAVGIVPDDAPPRGAGERQIEGTPPANLPPGYDPFAFQFFSKYWTEEEAYRMFEFVRSKDDEFFRLWQAWVIHGMYSRSVIDQKTRELCAIASMVAMNALPQVRAHVSGALAAGATPDETKEVILQQGVYAGLPYTMQALKAWEEAVQAFEQGKAYGGLR